MSPWGLTHKQDARAEAECGAGSHKEDGQGLPEACQHSTRTVRVQSAFTRSLRTHQSNGGSRPDDELEFELELELELELVVEDDVEPSRLLEELLLLPVMVIPLSLPVQSRTSDEWVAQ